MGEAVEMIHSNGGVDSGLREDYWYEDEIDNDLKWSFALNGFFFSVLESNQHYVKNENIRLQEYRNNDGQGSRSFFDCDRQSLPSSANASPRDGVVQRADGLLVVVVFYKQPSLFNEFNASAGLDVKCRIKENI
ncbi:hypothetical protein CKAN_00074500 [Cinnamomum micranthum f. kanehirae]|uniref:Uncharacterized protein n=1 Tax=Cinnamomum micranthum f. kanehirae TaxID=337451 RepID=A0A3S3M9Q3_9MAGN|nr:hypothetical protein CKAN_00074500 [Cinnamomum micranthum f. kanehirae]